MIPGCNKAIDPLYRSAGIRENDVDHFETLSYTLSLRISRSDYMEWGCSTVFSCKLHVLRRGISQGRR